MKILLRATQILTRYKAWSDDLFLSAVSLMPIEITTAPQPVIFGTLLRTLNHAYCMDYVWQCNLLGTSHGLQTRNPEFCPALEELAVKQRDMNAWYEKYADATGEMELVESVEFEFIGGGRGQLTRQEILMHVVNHATYHRGHAAGMLYQFGISPPTTDLPVFLRELAIGAPGRVA